MQSRTNGKRPTGSGSGAGQSTLSGGVDDNHSTARQSKIKRFDREVFTLACHLKGDSETAKPNDFEEAINQWAQDRNYSFVRVIQAVSEAWPKVAGDWTLETLLDGVQSDPVPEVGNPTYRSDSSYGDALKVCWRLQAHAGRAEPFFIGADKLASVLNVDKRTALRYLSAAHRDDVLVMAEEATPNRCRRWYMPAANPSIEQEAKRRAEDSTLPF